MSSEKTEPSSFIFIPVSIYNVPVNEKGLLTENLYVFLPIPKKYIVFVSVGEKFTFAKQTALKKHLFPIVFVKHNPESVAESDKTVEKLINSESMSEKGARSIGDICRDIFDAATEPPKAAMEKLEKMADDILIHVAPDIKEARKAIVETASYLWLMNDSAAISTLGTLCAYANNIGVDSKKPLRDIVCATLIMDFPLAQLGETVLGQYYTNPSSLKPDVLEKIYQHPFEAFRMAQRKLDHFTESTFDLILNHHELYNGTGYPKKVRTGTMSPFVQTFSLATDIFEKIKKANILGENKTIIDVLSELRETDIDPHARRHSQKLVDNVIKYLGQGI